MLDPYYLDLANVTYYVADQEEVLVAQHSLKNSQLLELWIVVDDFWVGKQNLKCLLFVNLVVKRAVKLDWDSMQLLGLTFIRDPVQLDVAGETLQNELTVGIVDDEAKLVVIHVLLDVLHRKIYVRVVWLLFDRHPSVVVQSKS